MKTVLGGGLVAEKEGINTNDYLGFKILEEKLILELTVEEYLVETILLALKVLAVEKLVVPNLLLAFCPLVLINVEKHFKFLDLTHDQFNYNLMSNNTYERILKELIEEKPKHYIINDNQHTSEMT